MAVVWVVLFQILGTAGIIAEILVPSFGVLTVMSIVAFGGSYYQLYQFNSSFIPYLVLINIFSVPATLLIAVKLLGKSPVALSNTLTETLDKEDICSVGEEGIALTDLRPAGKIKLNDTIVDVISTGDFIEKDTRVSVVKIDNTGIKVAAITADN